jgi:hypothetical protein
MHLHKSSGRAMTIPPCPPLKLKAPSPIYLKTHFDAHKAHLSIFVAFAPMHSATTLPWAHRCENTINHAHCFVLTFLIKTPPIAYKIHLLYPSRDIWRRRRVVDVFKILIGKKRHATSQESTKKYTS